MSYESTILALSPVLYIPFTETSGTTFSDITGNGHDGTIVHYATAGAADGPICGEKSVQVSGVPLSPGLDRVIDIANPSTLPISDHTFSYEFWRKGFTSEMFIHLRDTAYTGSAYSPGLASMEIFAEEGASPIDFRFVFDDHDDTTTLIDNVGSLGPFGFIECWHYFCLTYDGSGNMVFYYDGASIVTTTITGVSFTPAACSLVSAYTFGSSFPWSINHLAVYDYTLTSDQVASNYASATPRCDNPCFGLRLRKYSQGYLKQS